MYYYAQLNNNGVCTHLHALDEYQDITGSTEYVEITEEQYTSQSVLGKTYNFDTQTWEDASEAGLCTIEAEQISIGNRRLDLFIGDETGLNVGDSTINNLVAAINKCFQSASDGKTAISGAITAKDSGVTIPTNPTFAQLAASIGQISSMKVATGNLNVYTAPGGAISGNTAFRPRIVFFKNNQSGATNSNYGIYIDCEYFNFVKGATDPQALSVNYNEWGYNNGGSANDVFTITDTGWSANTGGLATNICWIAIG